MGSAEGVRVQNCAVPDEGLLWGNKGVQSLCSGLAAIAMEQSPILEQMENWVFAPEPTRVAKAGRERIEQALQEASDFSLQMLSVARRRGDAVAEAFAQAAHHECKTKRTALEFLKITQDMAPSIGHMYAAPAVWGATELMHNWSGLDMDPEPGSQKVEPEEVQLVLDRFAPIWERLGVKVTMDGELDVGSSMEIDDLESNRGMWHLVRVFNHIAWNARTHDRGKMLIGHEPSARKVSIRDEVDTRPELPIEEIEKRVNRCKGNRLLGRVICGPDWQHRDDMPNQGLGIGLTNAQKHARAIGAGVSFRLEELEVGQGANFVTEFAY